MSIRIQLHQASVKALQTRLQQAYQRVLIWREFGVLYNCQR